MRPARTVACVLALALLAGACGDDDKKKDTSIGDETTTSTIEGLTDTTVAGGSETTTKPGSTATTKKGAASATTAAAGSPGTRAEANVVAVAPGKYNYTAKGNATAKGVVNDVPFNTAKPVDKTWNVTYQAPQGRVQRANYAGAADIQEHALVHSAASADISFLRINNGGKAVTFTPTPAVRFVPVPGAVGATWSWTMTSQPDKDGNVVTRKADFKVERVEQLRVGGQTIPVLVILGNMTTDKPLLKTHKFTTYYSEALKLIVKEREITDSDVEAQNDNGQKTKLHVHTDVTTTIDSLTPAAPTA